MLRNDVASMSFRRHVPTRFLINQCQIITFLILKSDIIENSRIELRGIVLPAPSNQIKVTFIIILPLTWYICEFFLFHIETEGKVGWIIGGPKGILLPPSNSPLPTPMPQTYRSVYLLCKDHLIYFCLIVFILLMFRRRFL